MAKQTGPNPFTGRRGNLQGYRIGKQYYVRAVSSLTAKRVLRDPAFKLTRQYAGLLGKASKIASAIYRLLPVKEHGFYRKLTGMAMQLMKQGQTAENAFEELYNNFIRPALSVKGFSPRPAPHVPFADRLLKRLFSKMPKAQGIGKRNCSGPSAIIIANRNPRAVTSQARWPVTGLQNPAVFINTGSRPPDLVRPG